MKICILRPENASSSPILVLYKYMIGGLHSPLRKKILQLISLRCQISGPFLALLLQGAAPLPLTKKIVH